MTQELEKYVVTAVALNFRAEPSNKSVILGHSTKGDVIEKIAESLDELWIKHKLNNVEGWSSKKYLSKVGTNVPPPMAEFAWMPIANNELGVIEIPGKEHNPRVVQYLQTVTNIGTMWKSTDETPWCSAFVNWCVEKAGYTGTKSALSTSWLKWGRKIDQPIKGCIAIFSREGGSGHVGFYVEETVTQSETYIKILGGNQEHPDTEIGEVNLKHYLKSKLLGYRIPN